MGSRLVDAEQVKTLGEVAMRVITGGLRKLATSLQVLLLVVLSCVVLGVALMLIFDELQFLEPNSTEKMVYVWHQNNAKQALE